MARRALPWRLSIERVERVLTELIGASVRVVVRSIDDGNRRLRDLGARTAVALADEAAELDVRAEAALAARSVGHLLGRSAEIERPGEALDDALRGGFAALVLETVRRVTGAPARLIDVPAHDADPLCVAITLLFEDHPYEVLVSVRARWRPAPPADLAALGPLPVALPVVVAITVASRQLLSELEPGAAWLPGEGWTIGPEVTGAAMLAAPLSERGLPVELVQDGSVVLRGDPVSLSWDAEPAMQQPKDDQCAAEVVLDAPVVVRVEVGAVTMTARQWAELAPGDVIETGRRIAEPVVLRVGGQEVARGELVSVDGELGVRIRDLVGTLDAQR